MESQQEQASAAGAREPGADEQPPNQGERYEQGDRSQQQQYEQGDPAAAEGEDPFHLLERQGEHRAPLRGQDPTP